MDQESLTLTALFLDFQKQNTWLEQTARWMGRNFTVTCDRKIARGSFTIGSVCYTVIDVFRERFGFR
jgi:hypothetical protein